MSLVFHSRHAVAHKHERIFFFIITKTFLGFSSGLYHLLIKALELTSVDSAWIRKKEGESRLFLGTEI